jgi:chloramphenicol-sensitive protein RarD
MPRRPSSRPLAGLLSAVTAYLSWGLTPIYFKTLIAVPPFQILLHRIIWSLVLLLPLMAIMKRWPAFIRALTTWRTLLILLCSTLLVACNWFLFIWAINTDRILQASLGYYINPILNVLLGMVFLKERLRPMQVVALLLAASGVLFLTVYHGEFPAIALGMAFTFGLYGLIRKVAPVDSVEGLAVETLLLTLPAVGLLIYFDINGSGAIFRIDRHTDLLLMGCALVTALPLLLFTFGTRSLPFTTIGFLQYIAPSCTFLLAVFAYQEPFLKAQMITFTLIWIALVMFSVDATLNYRKTNRGISN